MVLQAFVPTMLCVSPRGAQGREKKESNIKPTSAFGILCRLFGCSVRKSSHCWAAAYRDGTLDSFSCALLCHGEGGHHKLQGSCIFQFNSRLQKTASVRALCSINPCCFWLWWSPTLQYKAVMPVIHQKSNELLDRSERVQYCLCGEGNKVKVQRLTTPPGEWQSRKYGATEGPLLKQDGRVFPNKPNVLLEQKKKRESGGTWVVQWELQTIQDKGNGSYSVSYYN